MTPSRNYLLVVVGLTVAAVGSVAALNLVVDPYDVFRWTRPAALGTKRPEARFHDRLHKAWAVRHADADAVLLGTSRVQIGLPAAEGLPDRAGRVLNLGLPGGTPYEALRYLQHAHARRKVRTAVLGLDLLMFNAHTPPQNEEFDEGRMLADASGEVRVAALSDLPSTLLSFEATRASLRTVRRRDLPGYLLADGRRDPAIQEQAFEHHAGARGMFRDADETYLGWFRCFEPSLGEDAPHARDFVRLLDFAAENGIELRLFISPLHARGAEVQRLAGHADAWDAWKRWLVRTIDAANARHPQRRVTLWDFSRARGYTTERVPAADDPQTRMQWYWDSSHYTPALGAKILARLFGRGAPEDAQFGEVLQASTLDAQLASMRADQDAWAAANPGDVQELRALNDAVREGKGPCPRR